MPQTRSRRVRGLRREEVAEAANISVAWYTWIERARDLKLSADTLKCLSVALRLGRAEQGHLYTLAGHPPPLFAIKQDKAILPVLQRMIGVMDPNLTYVLDPMWDLAAWSNGAKELFGDFGEIPKERRNMVRLTFS